MDLEDDYEYIGNFSAVDPAYSRAFSCDKCEVSYTGCADNFMCPKCGGGELPRADNNLLKLSQDLGGGV